MIGFVSWRGRCFFETPDGDEDPTNDETANCRHEQEHSGGLKHRDDVVDADVPGRRRLLDDIDDDRLLQQEEHLLYSLPQSSTPSASSAIVRTPTPVGPFGR